MKPVLSILLFFTIISSVSAHEGRPLYIQLLETNSGTFLLKMNIPNTVSSNNLPELIYPSTIIEKGLIKVSRTTSGYILTTQLEGKKELFVGSIFKIKYPKFNPAITTIIHIQLINEPVRTIVIGPEKNQFIVPKEPSQSKVMQQYSVLGIKHIWTGIDHLLFVACLLFVAGFKKKLLMVVTGFTIAHSITLFLASLNIIDLPISPIEASIALSILFLCYEIIHHHQTKTSLTYRYPVVVSSSFGLLHGLGFATILSEIGLPYNSKLTALLFFNVGVEIGQIIFVLALFLVYFVTLKVLKNRITKKLEFQLYRTSIYTIGILTSYWFFERLF